MRPIYRRTLLRIFAGLPFLAGPGLAAWRALAARRPPHFDQHVQQTLSAVIDRMLPADELPGAGSLGIDQHISAMADVPPRQPLRELHQTFADGVAWLDRRARAAAARDFLALDEAQQEALLTAGLNSKDEDAAGFVWTLRDRAFALYYTHPAIVGAFAYAGPPQPGGFPDFRDAPR
jgi:hypothetical protein